MWWQSGHIADLDVEMSFPVKLRDSLPLSHEKVTVHWLGHRSSQVLLNINLHILMWKRFLL